MLSKMNRREVIFRVGDPLAIPASRVLMACGSDSGGNPNSLSFTSSNDQNHTHTVSLLLTDISTPPAAGVTKTTSLDDAHTHTVSLTEADLGIHQRRERRHEDHVRGRDAGLRPHPHLRLPQVRKRWRAHGTRARQLASGPLRTFSRRASLQRALTSAGLPLPFIAFITWPTKKPKHLLLPGAVLLHLAGVLREDLVHHRLHRARVADLRRAPSPR